MKLLGNKKATFNYEVIESLSAGIELLGFEVKSLKGKLGSLEGSYIVIEEGELMIKGMHIPPYQPGNTPDTYDPYRLRKLLVTKDERDMIVAKKAESGLTAIPLGVRLDHNLIKVDIGLVRGKKRHDKRESIKRRDVARDIGRKVK